jgi:hypothetical protein
LGPHLQKSRHCFAVVLILRANATYSDRHDAGKTQEPSVNNKGDHSMKPKLSGLLLALSLTTLQLLAAPKGLNWLGAWNNASKYQANDAVFFSGSSWVAQRPNTNVSPL